MGSKSNASPILGLSSIGCSAFWVKSGGTGVYIEKVGQKSYFCTCYGDTHLKSDKEHRKLHATHHNMVWVKPDGTVAPAKEMRSHSDDELRALEKMVGRVPDFDKATHNDILKGGSGY